MRQLQTNEHKWIITVMQGDTEVWVQSKIPEPYIFKVSTCNQSRVVLCFKIVLLQLSCLFLVAVQISKDLITLRQASAHPQANMHSQTLKFWCPKLYGCNWWANDCLTCRYYTANISQGYERWEYKAYCCDDFRILSSEFEKVRCTVLLPMTKLHSLRPWTQ